MRTSTCFAGFTSHSCKQFLVYRLFLDFFAFPDPLSLFVFIFFLSSLSGGFKFFKSYLSHGSNFSSRPPFSSFLFYNTNYFPSYFGYSPASHFHLFLDAFLRNREVVLFNLTFSFIFSSIFDYGSF